MKNNFLKLHTFPTTLSQIVFVCRHLFLGMSIYRAQLHWFVKSKEFKGNVLDLGSGSSKPSYIKFLDTKNLIITFTDLYPKDSRTLKIDLLKPFTFKEKYDVIFCLNLLEHLYKPEVVIKSSIRHLKPKGELVGVVPYLHNFHNDPEDFFRYSHSALSLMLKEAGFKKIDIYYLGNGPFIAAFAQLVSAFPRFINPIFYLIALSFDLLLLKFSKMFKHKYALSYGFIAKK